MKIAIESTDQVVRLDGVPCRVWRGRTERGYECVVFVHRIAVPARSAASGDLSLDVELDEQSPPRGACWFRWDQG